MFDTRLCRSCCYYLASRVPDSVSLSFQSTGHRRTLMHINLSVIPNQHIPKERCFRIPIINVIIMSACNTPYYCTSCVISQFQHKANASFVFLSSPRPIEACVGRNAMPIMQNTRGKCIHKHPHKFTAKSTQHLQQDPFLQTDTEFLREELERTCP